MSTALVSQLTACKVHATHIVFAMGAQFTFPNIDAALAGANQLSSWREIVKVSPIFPSRPILQDVSAWQRL